MQDGGQFAAMVGSGHSDWGRVIARAERGLCKEGLPPEKEGLLRYWLGMGLYETGDLYRSERELQRAVELGTQVPDLAEMRADGLYRLGLIHRLLGRAEQEVAAFREAACCHAALHQAERAVLCLAEAAWAQLLAAGADAALPALEAALAGLRGLKAPDLAIRLGIVQALYSSLAGDRQASDQQCLALLDRPPLQPVQRAEIAWILGHNALAAGDRTAAEFHLAIAHEQAVIAWWPPQMERIAQLRRSLSSHESRRSSPRG